jgi:hypothetical protein
VLATDQTGICPSGSSPITSVEECGSAATSIGGIDTTVDMWPGHQTGVPSGCWLYNDQLRFSDNPSNWDFQGNNGYVYVICKVGV